LCFFGNERFVTGNYWNVVINFDVQWCQTIVQHIEQVFAQLKWSQGHRISPDKFVNWEEVEQARVAVSQVDQELRTFQITTRFGRGWVNP
jgi:hypothetical protein